jgi:hypothetical protein
MARWFGDEGNTMLVSPERTLGQVTSLECLVWTIGALG